ncbi:glycosyl hydrolase family 18 protein [Actinomadura sp. KC06]|uniref:glycosyl hydrolase family 18 protein n=1 Tax=Actinomadura sp. KC06 TaxID=2530369 RepID=UPI002442C7A7|nr:glycosyl hydrolase family 18 protein [Actinomadura sp. KC06]
MRTRPPLRRIFAGVTALLLMFGLSVAITTPAHAAGPTAACRTVQEWGGGAQYTCTITNSGTGATSGWKLEFDLGSNVRMGSYWDASLTSSGTHHTFTNRNYNGTISPGGTASFGFLVSFTGTLSGPENCKLDGQPCDGGPSDAPPSAPANLRTTEVTPTSVSLAWDAASDDQGVKNYDVLNGSAVAATATGTTATVSGLTANTRYTFTVRARDTSDQLSEVGAPVTVTTPGSGEDAPPSKPAELRVSSTEGDTVKLAWNAATDDNGVAGYDVLQNGSVAQSVTGTTASVSGLRPGSYRFAVRAKDSIGQFSELSNEVTATVGAGTGGCRPDGLYQTPGVTPAYCEVYDQDGREKMGDGHPRRAIGYFTSWRTGKDKKPRYLANDIPWDKVTHLNYAFAHVDEQNKVSVGGDKPTNPAIGMEWPEVPGAEMDPSLPYKGHFNLLNKYKKQHPNVKTLISIGGWAESGGYIDDNGNRVASGGFYTMTDTQAKINTFADSVVEFLRKYGFNGADIDYEYATSMQYAGHPDDFTFSNPRRAKLMAGYVALMKTLREKLDAAGAADGKHYLLTAAVSASGWILRGHDSYQVVPYLDYANIMSYDLHGTWNHFVGPNAALYDDGKDNEQQEGGVYNAYGMGYLNTDWAYHYFRGSMQAGRINIGVPFYTRGWKNVQGGTNGLWGKSALPDQKQCPKGTAGDVGSTTPCGDGGIGIDNIWHDLENGKEMASGSNPMWHAKNLEKGLQGTYIGDYGLDPANDPDDRLVGTYTRNYNSTMKTPWLWNATEKVFLSTEDEESLAAKAKYVADKGIGGIMIWELSGDYAWDPARNDGKGEYFMGKTLINVIHDGLKNAAPYGNLKSSTTMPTDVLDVKVDLVNFPVGDANYPITPKMRITNNSGQTIPGGATFKFDYGTSAPASMTQQTGWTLSVQAGHTGNNVGGLKGDFQKATLTVPSYTSIPNGGSATIALSYQLPIATPSNFVLTFGGKSYVLTQDSPRSTSVGGLRR